MNICILQIKFAPFYPFFTLVGSLLFRLMGKALNISDKLRSDQGYVVAPNMIVCK